MTIYEVLNETAEDDLFSAPEDIRPEVELALQDQFGENESQWDDVKAKFGSWKAFVDRVIEELAKTDCDESWLDGEVYMNIEGVGQDILDGEPVGTRRKQLAEIMGTDGNGRLNRTAGFEIELG